MRSIGTTTYVRVPSVFAWTEKSPPHRSQGPFSIGFVTFQLQPGDVVLDPSSAQALYWNGSKSCIVTGLALSVTLYMLV